MDMVLIIGAAVCFIIATIVLLAGAVEGFGSEDRPLVMILCGVVSVCLLIAWSLHQIIPMQVVTTVEISNRFHTEGGSTLNFDHLMEITSVRTHKPWLAIGDWRYCEIFI